jgi:hypothetical protein
MVYALQEKVLFAYRQNFKILFGERAGCPSPLAPQFNLHDVNGGFKGFDISIHHWLRRRRVFRSCGGMVRISGSKTKPYPRKLGQTVNLLEKRMQLF